MPLVGLADMSGDQGWAAKMTRDEVLAIIKEERLKRYDWFKDSPTKDSLVIQRDGREWRVFMTDERAATRGTVNRFTDESAALDTFIERLRLWNKILADDKKRDRRREERKRRE